MVYGTLRSKNPNAKTIAFYSLYDVMPVDEPEWKVEPFGAEIVDPEVVELPKEYGPCIVARGARNQKGPTMGFLRALETLLQVKGDIPVNVKFVIEGEEEIGSFNLDVFCQTYADRLKDVSCVWYGNPAIDEKGRQVLYGGAKGIISFELICEGEEWGGPMKQSLFAPDTDPCVDAARRAGKALGYDSVFWPRYYACVPLYAFNRAPLNLPVISAGIGRMGRLHAANEYITVEGLNLYEKFSVAFLKELAKDPQ